MRGFISKSFLLALVLVFYAPGFQTVNAEKPHRFLAEVWADNWFSLYVNGKKVGEDSVPIATVRSFNSEKIAFSATYPLTIGFIVKDYQEDASGLEYIGTPRQQIGDGGFIAQIKDLTSNKLIAVSDESFRIMVLNKAPINPECISSQSPVSDCRFTNTTLPKTWLSSSYKDSQWAHASVFSEAEVGVKEGYFDISWSTKAKLIWSKDLKLDNTVAMRRVVKNP